MAENEVIFAWSDSILFDFSESCRMADVGDEIRIFTKNNDWLDILDQYKITWVIMALQSELIKNLRNEFGWEELYLDDTAAILFREP